LESSNCTACYRSITSLPDQTSARICRGMCQRCASNHRLSTRAMRKLGNSGHNRWYHEWQRFRKDWVNIGARVERFADQDAQFCELICHVYAAHTVLQKRRAIMHATRYFYKVGLPKWRMAAAMLPAKDITW
jgi:hypothetical protein